MRRNGNGHEFVAVGVSHCNLTHGLRLRISALNVTIFDCAIALDARLQIACLRNRRHLVFGQAVDVAAIEARAGAGGHDTFANAIGLARGDDVKGAFVVDFEIQLAGMEGANGGGVVPYALRASHRSLDLKQDEEETQRECLRDVALVQAWLCRRPPIQCWDAARRL